MKTRIFTATATVLLLAVSLFSSCRKEGTLVYNPEDAYYRTSHFETLEEQWKYLWQAMDNQYVFWDIDTTDWDALYDKYCIEFRKTDEKLKNIDEQFQKGEIGILDWYDLNRQEMVSVLVDKLCQNLIFLTDQHFIIGFYNNYDEEMYEIEPSRSRVKLRQDYHPSLALSQTDEELGDIVFNGIANNYGVTPDYAQYYQNPLLDWAYSCRLCDGILYLRLGRYFLSDSYGFQWIKHVIDSFFSGIAKASADGTLKGIILDNRSNPGGFTEDFKFIPGRFISQPVKMAEEKTKNGLGRYDHSPYMDKIIHPAEETIDIGDAPFVILQDMHSASMGEGTGYACTLSIPSAITMGERSRGATGMLLSYYPDIYHAGSANYANGGPYIYTSTFSAKYLDRSDNQWKSFESIGFEPDIYCPLDYEQLASGGRDTQLDCAVQYILSK